MNLQMYVYTRHMHVLIAPAWFSIHVYLVPVFSRFFGQEAVLGGMSPLSDWFICYFRVLGRSFREGFWTFVTCFSGSFRSTS